MKPTFRLLSALFLGAPLLLSAQLQSDADARDQMKYDVKYLASDLLEGREAGTAGERLAVEYIAAKFGNVGLMPYGDSASYVQAFTFNAEPVRGAANTLQLGRKKLKLDEQWFPMAFSGTGPARGKIMKLGYGISAPDLKLDDYADVTSLKDRIVAISISSPD